MAVNLPEPDGKALRAREVYVELKSSLSSSQPHNSHAHCNFLFAFWFSGLTHVGSFHVGSLASYRDSIFCVCPTENWAWCTYTVFA